MRAPASRTKYFWSIRPRAKPDSQSLLEFRRGPEANRARRRNRNFGHLIWIESAAGLAPPYCKCSKAGHAEALVFADCASDLLEGQFDRRRHDLLLLSRRARNRFDQFCLGHLQPSSRGFRIARRTAAQAVGWDCGETRILMIGTGQERRRGREPCPDGRMGRRLPAIAAPSVNGSRGQVEKV